MHRKKPFLAVLNVSADDTYLEELLLRLEQFKSEVDVWSQRALRAGEDSWATARHCCEKANAVVLLMSPDFLSSTAYSLAQIVLMRWKRRPEEVLLIPVIVRAADLEFGPFGRFRALPVGGVPLSRVRDRDAAWLHVVRELREAIARFWRGAGRITRDDSAPTPSGLDIGREQSESFRHARSLRAVGDRALLRFEHARARSSYEAALETYRRVQDFEGVAYCLRKLGEVALDRRDYTEAQSMFGRALTLYRRIRHLDGEVACRWGLASLYVAHSSPSRARAQCGAALEIYSNASNRFGMAWAYWKLASVSEGSQRIRHLHKARKLWQATENLNLVERAERELTFHRGTRHGTAASKKGSGRAAPRREATPSGTR